MKWWRGTVLPSILVVALAVGFGEASYTTSRSLWFLPVALPVGLVAMWYWRVARGARARSRDTATVRQPSDVADDEGLETGASTGSDDSWGLWGARVGRAVQWSFVGGLVVWFGVVSWAGWRGAAWVGIGLLSAAIVTLWRRYVR